jgi:Mn2+/Fe2+ NRAMP family transporter
VEEDRKRGKATVAQRRGSTNLELSVARDDVLTGMFFSNLVMFFIILTTAATLHAHGVRNIETAKQASEALRPLAGNGAYWLFTLGLIGTGMLGVPVLAGSCAYGISEAASWKGDSLARAPLRAAPFYMVIAGAMVVGLALDFAGLNAVKMLFWSAVVNGVLAPPLVVLVVLLTSDKKVMGTRANSRGAKVLGWICAAVMSAAALALLVT